MPEKLHNLFICSLGHIIIFDNFFCQGFYQPKTIVLFSSTLTYTRETCFLKDSEEKENLR